MKQLIRIAILATLISLMPVAATGCQRQLIPTPTAHVDDRLGAFAAVAPELQTSAFRMLYVTDRAERQRPGRPVEYGYHRSRALAFGWCEINFGEELDWEKLVEASTSRNRSQSVSVSAGLKTPIAAFPSVPGLLVQGPDGITEDGAFVEGTRQAERQLQAAIREALQHSQRREVYITVHGIQNSFDDAAMRSAELWHFLGREGAVVIYTWPAGHPGLLEGYHYDAVSSMVTVYHFKQLLRTIGKMHDIDRVNIIAHSRGTDVVATSLRELYLAGYGNEPGGNKLGELVYIAADLDWDIILQRDIPHRVFEMIGRTSIYMYEDDLALALSKFLWKGSRRVGQLRLDDLGPEERELLRLSGGVDLIDVQAKIGGLGHGYYTNPSVSSDLVLLLREGRDAGAEHGRPIEPVIPGVWLLPEDYLEH